MKTNLFKKSLQVAAFGLITLVGLSSCKKEDSNDAPTPTPTPTANVKISNNANLGELMTDANGKTLYFFAKDVEGISVCKDGCLDAWPLFYEKELAVGEGLDKANFGVITRADGKKQTTYKGWPLYRFANDAAAGDTKGEGVGKTWYVSNPNYTLMVGNKENKSFLISVTGRTVYTFGKDGENLSNCTDGCTTSWPLISQGTVKVPSLVNKANFGSITRADGKTQTTFLKKPIYYFAGDTQRGDVKGSAIANWFLSTIE